MLSIFLFLNMTLMAWSAFAAFSRLKNAPSIFFDLVVQYRDSELVTSVPPVVIVVFSPNKFTSMIIIMAKITKKTTKAVIPLVCLFLLSTSSMIVIVTSLIMYIISYNFLFIFHINIWCSPEGAHHILNVCL